MKIKIILTLKLLNNKIKDSQAKNQINQIYNNSFNINRVEKIKYKMIFLKKMKNNLNLKKNHKIYKYYKED